MKTTNRIRSCPFCPSGKLSWDKDAVTSEAGIIYRRRHCPHCGSTITSRQAREEITGCFDPEGRPISAHAD